MQERKEPGTIEAKPGKKTQRQEEAAALMQSEINPLSPTNTREQIASPAERAATTMGNLKVGLPPRQATFLAITWGALYGVVIALLAIFGYAIYLMLVPRNGTIFANPTALPVACSSYFLFLTGVCMAGYRTGVETGQSKSGLLAGPVSGFVGVGVFQAVQALFLKLFHLGVVAGASSTATAPVSLPVQVTAALIAALIAGLGFAGLGICGSIAGERRKRARALLLLRGEIPKKGFWG